MSPWVGIFLAHFGFMAAGLGVLELAGALRPVSLWRLIFAAGLAYIVGAATVGITLIVLNVFGVGLSRALIIAVFALFTIPVIVRLVRPSTWRGRFRRPTLAELRAIGVENWAAGAICVGLLGIGAAGARALAYAPLTGDKFDLWLIWIRKAVLLFYNGHFPDIFVSAKVESGAHWDYPLLFSMMQAVQFRAAGEVVPERAQIVPWVILIATIFAAGYLVRRTTKPIVWSAVLGGVLLLEAPQAVSGLADTPMACFLALGTLAMGIWIDSGRRSDLVIAAVVLGGAASMKIEGTMGALLVFVIAVAIEAASRDWRRTGMVAAAGAAMVLVAIIPWRYWVSSHPIVPTTPLSKALSPAYLIHNWDRVWPSVRALYSVLATLNLVQLVLPAAIALIIVRVRSVPRLSVFYVTVGLGYFGALVWAYWTTPLDLSFLIGTSVSRLHIGIVMLSTVAILHLSGDLTGRHGEDVAPASDETAISPEPLPRLAQPTA